MTNLYVESSSGSSVYLLPKKTRGRYQSMKILWFLLSLLFSTHGLSADIEGMFNCKIERQTVWSIVDGKVTVFSGYSNRPKNGEYVKVRYGIKRASIYFVGDEIPFFKMIFLERAKKGGNRDTSWVDSEAGFDTIQVGESTVYAGSAVSKLLLERYYKNDWHGLVTSVDKQSGVPDLSQQTVAMTCRHVTDRIDQVMQILGQRQD